MALKKGQSQRQTQIVNVHVKGTSAGKPKKAKRKGKKGKGKESKVETRIIPAFNPPPIINYPPAFDYQHKPNNWIYPEPPRQPKAAKVLVEGETADILGVPAYTPVDLALESRLREAAPAPNIAERAAAESTPFVPPAFLSSSAPLSFPKEEQTVVSGLSAEEPLYPPDFQPEDENLTTQSQFEYFRGTGARPTSFEGRFGALPPIERGKPAFSLEEQKIQKGEEVTPAKKGRPKGAKGKPKASGIEFIPTVGTSVVGAESVIPLSQLDPSQYVSLTPSDTEPLVLGSGKKSKHISVIKPEEASAFVVPSSAVPFTGKSLPYSAFAANEAKPVFNLGTTYPQPDTGYAFLGAPAVSNVEEGYFSAAEEPNPLERRRATKRVQQPITSYLTAGVTPPFTSYGIAPSEAAFLA